MGNGHERRLAQSKNNKGDHSRETIICAEQGILSDLSFSSSFYSGSILNPISLDVYFAEFSLIMHFLLDNQGKF